MKAIITIFGNDKVGIIASVSTFLASKNINILDITQTVMRDYFTMTMLVDLDKMNIDFVSLQEELINKGREIQMDIRIQREDIFKKMYEI